ncbi:MAG: gluconokinase, partial [Verrucomicrobiota bacterium]
MSQPFVVIMGVSGCGKTTIASRLAESLQGTYLEGDAFHTPENKAKMGAGVPLVDEDRWPWFNLLIAEAQKSIGSGSIPVLSCSALREAYREYLFHDFAEPKLVYLKGSFELIKARMDERDHEYMTSELLRSQFETLEEPVQAPHLLTLSIELSPEDLLTQ